MGSLSEAWLRSLEKTTNSNGGRVINLVMTVTEPMREIELIRTHLDNHLETIEEQSVNTVAHTIFPKSLYVHPNIDWTSSKQPGNATDIDKAAIDKAAQDLYDRYISALPVLLTCHSNRIGTYFSRMISWPGKESGGVNQLDLLIQRLRKVSNNGQSTNNTLNMDLSADSQAADSQTFSCIFGGTQVYAADDMRFRGFPCLVHLDFSLLNGVLHCAAVYRHHYVVSKAYGNLLGLSWLMDFLCHQTGFKMGELMVVAGLADAKSSLIKSRELAFRLRKYLDHGDGLFGESL